ncbi:DUF4268 domain-containing protein [Pareuzebyella sediminis]|uniref:DUF4268 domain-containing protein n=1 Tax=Pareuzebyella sediminis TaxID=2607998 RepID=UPI0011EE2A7C|nr:DUF4268 domain-containing protein [Pareuzebyella sediminis]
MFSKSESKQIRQEFWIAFGKSYPKKWILYNTKIKGLAFKFHFEVKKALVSLDVETDDIERRIILWDKLLALKSILKSEDFLPEAHFEDAFVLDNGKEISRIFVRREKISIHNKNTWQESMQFLSTHMQRFEDFFLAYREILEI